MNLKADMILVWAMMELLPIDAWLNRDQESIKYDADIKRIEEKTLISEAGVSIQSSVFYFFDYFHVSPVKVHLSFSLQGLDDSSPDTIAASVKSSLVAMFSTGGSMIADIDDVCFK